MTELFPLLTDTWHFFRRHLVAICALMFPFIIPLNLLNVFLEATSAENSQLFWLATIFDLLLMPIYQGAVILYIASAVSGTYLASYDYYRLALKFWLPLVVLYIFTVLALAIGFILFIFPAFIVLARLAFSEFYCILEQLQPTDAFTKSWEQTKDYQWTILAGILIILFITALPIWLIQALGSDQGTINPILSFFLNLAGAILATPITIFGFRVFTLHQDKLSQQEKPNS